MLLIFVDKISERLIYTLDFIFKDRAISYELTNDWYYFEKQDKFKLVYSEKFTENHLTIFPATVLFDEAIFNYAISRENFYREECLAFDKVTDPLASIFYILSRYEEYTCKHRDLHDRFEAKHSILVKYGWLEKVICDRICCDLIAFIEDKLATRFKQEKIPLQLVPTFDIDNVYAFQWKNGLRKYISLGRDKLKKDKVRLQARKNFNAGLNPDPYDSFEEIKSLSTEGFATKIFWLVGEYSKFDKNVSASDARHQELMRDMAHFAEIGLHPSYKSNSSIYYLKKEQQTLNHILKRKINISRQHFLKLNLPETYHSLQSLGFTDDYSMGFSDAIGFRAGTSRSFLFFDLLKNSPTDFRIHPFAYMDGTLNTYMKLSPAAAQVKIKALFDEVKDYGGDFIFLWHNETITDFGNWKSWKKVFHFTLNLKNEI